MSKAIKQLELDDLRKTLSGIKDYVILEPLKVDSATEVEFRKKLRAQKVRVKLVKNSYAKKILGEMGVTLNVWGGPTLLCWGGESVKGLANAVDTAVKESKKDPKAPEKFKVKTGVCEGAPMVLDVMKTVPTRLEAIGDVVGALLGPGAAIAGALTGPATQLAGILKAIEEKAPEAAPAA
jgi:ribosomal protein L10